MVEALGIPGLARQYVRDPALHINDRLPYIMDPSAGSGTFLLAAMHAVTSRLQEDRVLLATNADVRDVLTRWLPESAPNTWAAEFLYGIEKREDLATSTKVNMVLHQDGHTHVYKDDALAPLNEIASRHNEEKFRTHTDRKSGYPMPVAETMDVVITNPPFSLTLDAAVIASLSRTFTLSQQRNSENLFLERWYQLLKPGGRLGAVLPESFFSTPENAAARRFLFHHFHVRAIVSLPVHAFQPWTPTRTSLLFAQRKTAAAIKEWGDRYNENEQSLNLSYRHATAALRRLRSPRKNETYDDLRPAREELTFQLKGLGVNDVPPLATDRDIEKARQLLSSIDVSQIAFSRTVSALASEESYVGIVVAEIGYRRTKRGETNKRNDLFLATVTVNDETTVIRNLSLNAAGGKWRISTDASGVEALSQLIKADLWN